MRESQLASNRFFGLMEIRRDVLLGPSFACLGFGTTFLAVLAFCLASLKSPLLVIGCSLKSNISGQF
jgi:hypothetical protein